MVRRAGLWIFTLSFAAALPSLVGSGGTPRANAVVPSEPAGGASSSVVARGSDLQSADPAARACAARELGARGVESIASVPGLVTLLADDTIVSMPECIDDGEWHGGLDRVDDVIDRPTSPAREASRALSRIGAAAVQPLVTALGDVRATMRRYAVIALGLIDDHTVVKPAVARLETTLGDSDWQVRRSAVWALAGSGDASTFGAIAGRLKDDYPRVREMAARGLGRMEDRRAVSALTGALGDPEWSVRREVVHGLGQLHANEAVDAIIQRLDDEHPEVRQMAAWALGEIEDRRAAPGLRHALGDRDAKVRHQAGWALGQLKDGASIDALVAVIRQDEAGSVREMSCWALGEIDDVRALPGLTAALKDRDGNVRDMAAWALGEIGSADGGRRADRRAQGSGVEGAREGGVGHRRDRRRARSRRAGRQPEGRTS